MAKSASTTKVEENKTDKKQHSDSVKSLTWSIREVDLETRTVFSKVAKMRGKTISQLITGEVRAYLQGILTQDMLPATSKDMDNQISLAKIFEKIEKIEAKQNRPIWKRILPSSDK